MGRNGSSVRMSTITALFLAGILGIGCTPQARAQGIAPAGQDTLPEVPVTSLKQSIAVFDFEMGADGPSEAGRGIADMVTTQLVQSSRFTVIERQEIERITAEQGLALSGAITPAQAARVGQLLGVELAVFGTITEFGEQNRRVGIGRLAVNRRRARVVVDVRFVDTTTGEIVYAQSHEGAESELGLDTAAGNLDFSNVEAWGNTRMGKAAEEAAGKVARYAAERVTNAAWHGTVLSVATDGPYCYIKPGARAGLIPGNVLFVYREGQELIDPDTGLVLGSETRRIAKIQIIDPSIGEGQASRCLILEGTGLARGDLVKVR